MIPAGTFTPSFWIQRISTTGLVTILNLRTTANGTGGWWDLDLSYLGTGWTRITATTPGVTVHYAFTSTGASNDGLYFRALSTVSFNLWGAQINTGTLPAGYQVTTTAALVSPESVTLSLPDPAHTHSTALQNLTSGAGTAHTHTFTGSGVPDPPNEVFLPYFRR